VKFGIHSEQYQNNHSKEEEQKFTQVFGELTSEFASNSYRDHYEEIAKGLGKFHYDAVCIWADKNL